MEPNIGQAIEHAVYQIQIFMAAMTVFVLLAILIATSFIAGHISRLTSQPESESE